MIRRIFWNPRWNESLYMATCAEKLLENFSHMHEDELLTRLGVAIANGETGDKIAAPAWLIFRIVVFKRESELIVQQVGFISSPRRLDGNAGMSSAT
jgi:hypothetical protein